MGWNSDSEVARHSCSMLRKSMLRDFGSVAILVVVAMTFLFSGDGG
jgi:hypothetical protein